MAAEIAAADFFDGVDHNAPNFWEDTTHAGRITLQPDDELVATQKWLNADHPAWSDDVPDDADEPSIVTDGETAWVSDGHHRIARARQQRRPITAQLHHLH